MAREKFVTAEQWEGYQRLSSFVGERRRGLLSLVRRARDGGLSWRKIVGAVIGRPLVSRGYGGTERILVRAR